MGKSVREFVDEALELVREVPPEVAADEAKRGRSLLLDVREPEEFAEGHVPGALNYPRGMLEVRADLEHPKRDPRLADRSQHIVCYCGSGVRSALAAKALLEMGFADPWSMAGGWSEWEEKGLPVER